MDLIIAILLGILQGVTEWLPISSSGHLALAQNTLGLDVPVVFDIFIHIGTLAAVCIFYRKDIVSILRSLTKFNLKSKEIRLALLIIAAMIPTAIIGFTFKPFFESMFSSNVMIGMALIITGTILYAASRAKPSNKPVSFIPALIIGIFQGIAVAPGISRSGATISAGLLQGINAREAARFSFLLSIPAVIGATIFEVKDTALAIDPSAFLPYVIGAVVAAAVGYFSIKFLLKLLEERKFQWFAYYCWLVGIFAIASFGW
jgi:undecaprenyl-diphosphatase